MSKILTEQWKQAWNAPARPFIGRAREVEQLVGLMQRPGAVINVSGVVGSGKTSLIQAAARSVEFPGGVHYLHGFTGMGAEDFRGVEVGMGPSLIIIDDADYASPAVRDRLVAIAQARGSDVRVVLASREPVITTQYGLALTGLSSDELIQFWAAEGVSVSRDINSLLHQASAGNVAIAKMVADLIRDGEVSPAEAAQLLGEFTAGGIYGPDGTLIQPGTDAHGRVSAELVVASEQVLKHLDARPEEIFHLDGRQFEELVAELLTRQGFEVRLTPATRDGGKDLYALKKTGLGTVLYVAECKKYAPHRRVGIEVVQRLYGVVQAEKLTGGLVVTTSGFSRDATTWQETVQYQIGLRNYVQLRAWIRDAVKAGS
ncbi:MAG TPA: restriction endonuclease [Bryobacteraceae bacterium]|nr:restriction endonuclease [Bryobacteraceae bacterium]